LDEFLDAPRPDTPPPATTRIILGVLAGLALLGALAWGAFSLLLPDLGPPPAEIAADPLLTLGRELYFQRCNSCHGETGRGDGPLGKALASAPPPGTDPARVIPPGDLTDDQWKHGDRPDQVLAVITSGVPGTNMAAWKAAFNADELKALAAYTYHLAGRDVPDELRNAEP
jgi:cytochrome c oxidase cbb3-type subunit 3